MFQPTNNVYDFLSGVKVTPDTKFVALNNPQELDKLRNGPILGLFQGYTRVYTRLCTRVIPGFIPGFIPGLVPGLYKDYTRFLPGIY